MIFSNVRTVSWYTFKEAIRAKWLLVFALVFFLLAINIPMLVLLAVRYLPPNYLEIYLNYLVTLSFPFLPLLALPMGAASIVEERESGALQYVLSNPISKSEFLIGRILGLLFATTAVIVLGYGVASGITFSLNVSKYGAVGEVMLIGAGLNAIMVGLSLIISVASRRKATALGVAIFFWFLFTVLSDLGFLSTVVALRAGPQAVLPIIVANPIEVSRILAVLMVGSNAEQLGVTGNIVTYVLGPAAAPILILSLGTWITATVATSFLVFRHQDI